MKKIFVVIITILIVNILQAQVAIGDWRIHSPYNRSIKIVDAGEQLYCITESGVFRYNIVDNSTEPVSRVSGLSDVNVTCGAYSDGKLIFGYDNGNIDIIYGNEVYNLPYIKQKELYGSKRINNIYIYNDFAYLSCGFGIVQVDLIRKEIKDTYLIGNNSTQKFVYDFTQNGNYFYAATEDGIYKADINSQNLAFYGNWYHIDDVPQSTSPFNIIETFNQKIYTVSNNQIYIGDNNQWTAYNPDTAQVYYDLQAENNELYISNDNYLTVVDANNQVVEKIINLKFPWGNTYPHIRNVVKKDDKYFFADYYAGMVKHLADVDYMIKPNGPATEAFTKIDIFKGKLWGVQGGVTSFWSPQGKAAYAMNFDNNTWTNKTYHGISDLCDVCVDRNNPERVYLSSYNGGIVQITGQNTDTIYKNFDPPYSGMNNYWTYGLDMDEDGNLWVSMRAVNNQFCVKTTDNKWHLLNYRQKTGVDWIGDILVTKSGVKWVILPRVGLFAFDDKGTYENTDDDTYRKFQTLDENGDVVSSQNLCFAEDKDGTIWVGTDKGVVTYFYPDRVFNFDFKFTGQRVIIEQNGVPNYLLGSEEVTAIAVDGANNKWFGTKYSGVFKINEDGTEELAHYTAENSPLLSNNILSIAINDLTGEIFIGTDKGLISYKGTATEGNEFYTDVYAYPNPVPHDYTGPIAIKGLIENANVKITDISGNLVYELKAEGGQAVWNGKNFAGERVKTGVYLAFCSDDLGEKTFVTKILFIN